MGKKTPNNAEQRKMVPKHSFVCIKRLLKIVEELVLLGLGSGVFMGHTTTE
jgi:hypothetical protein